MNPWWQQEIFFIGHVFQEGATNLESHEGVTATTADAVISVSAAPANARDPQGQVSVLCQGAKVSSFSHPVAGDIPLWGTICKWQVVRTWA